MNSRRFNTVAFSVLFTASVLVVGYVLLGLLPAFLFAFGYLGGLILWLTVPTNAPFDSIRWPYFLTLAFFVLHKWEEREYNFFLRFPSSRESRCQKSARFGLSSFTHLLLSGFAFLGWSSTHTRSDTS